jgi:hypothetical protein
LGRVGRARTARTGKRTAEAIAGCDCGTAAGIDICVECYAYGGDGRGFGKRIRIGLDV